MNDQLYVRDYSEKDFNEVEKLWEDTGMGGKQRGDNHSIIEKSIILGGKLLILENQESGEIIGTSWLTFDGRRIYLHHFGIKPEYQKKGYSKILLKESLQFAQNKGVQIKVEVHKDNEVALHLYRKGGFNYLGDYLVFIIRDFNKL